ncbi:MAG: hypothetical protein FWK04_18965 [Nostoc sp. GBBB01]|nr:hypothetical protein [Nostoc sp. GBBB01]
MKAHKRSPSFQYCDRIKKYSLTKCDPHVFSTAIAPKNILSKNAILQRSRFANAVFRILRSHNIKAIASRYFF